MIVIFVGEWRKKGMVQDSGGEVALVQSARQPILRSRYTHHLQVRKVRAWNSKHQVHQLSAIYILMLLSLFLSTKVHLVYLEQLVKAGLMNSLDTAWIGQRRRYHKVLASFCMTLVDLAIYIKLMKEIIALMHFSMHTRNSSYNYVLKH